MSIIASTLSRTGTNPLDFYDHPISLIDSTKPAASRSDTEDDEPSRTTTNDPLQAAGRLRKTLSTKGVKESIARRKYRKWQQETFPEGEPPEIPEVDPPEEPLPSPEQNPRRFMQRSETGQSSIKRWPQTAKAQTPGTQPGVPKDPKGKDTRASEVDVLYENQRGWFFFGIPLYSSKSLLNFDPSAWVTKELKESAVNITNAQLPDPSWEWAWKQWYVDMSHDVDEEGWQYSFSFASQFSWHGTHPWFHSFARRRRWLRKRVKTHHAHHGTDDAHMLTPEYFTIHPHASQSRDSSLTRQPGTRTTYISPVAAHETDDEDHDISGITALMSALKKAPIDREKIDALKKFVASGGEEVAYLQQKMPEIVATFVFQNSRRQLLQYLSKTLEDSLDKADAQDVSTSGEPEDAKRMSQYLQNAIAATEDQIRDLEFWSDVKHATNGSRPTTKSSNQSKQLPAEEFDMNKEIRGISEKAHVGAEKPRVYERPEGKGKEKAVDQD